MAAAKQDDGLKSGARLRKGCKKKDMATLKELSLMQAEGDDIGINVVNYDKRTILHVMAGKGDVKMVKYLVEELKANLDVEDRFGGTPLDDALRMNKKDVSAYLTEKGASVGKCFVVADDSGALCDAASRGDTKILRMLSKRGVSMDNGDYDRRTGIHLASAEGQLGAVKCLVDFCGADVNVLDRWSGTPLDDALKAGHDSVFEFLKSKGAKSGKISTVKAEDATALCDSAFNGSTDNLQKMVDNGLDVNLADYDDRTALHLAASEGLLLVASFLIKELGADPNVSDRYGGTPLDDALRSGHTKVADFLKECGALRGKTAEYAEPNFLLLQAAATGNLKALRQLHDEQIDMYLGNEDSRTALHLAAANGHIACVQELIENMEIHVNIPDRFGGTPLDDAVLSGDKDVISYLESQGGTRMRETIITTRRNSKIKRNSVIVDLDNQPSEDLSHLKFASATASTDVSAVTEEFFELSTADKHSPGEAPCEASCNGNAQACAIM